MQLMPTRKLDYSQPWPRATREREREERMRDYKKEFNGRSLCEYDIRGLSVYSFVCSLTSDREKDKILDLSTIQFVIKTH